MVAYLALCLLALSARSARVNHDVSQGEAREGVNITSQILAAVDMPDRPHAMLPDNSPNGCNPRMGGPCIISPGPPKIGEHPKLLETSAEEKFLETDAEEKPIKSSENPQVLPKTDMPDRENGMKKGNSPNGCNPRMGGDCVVSPGPPKEGEHPKLIEVGIPSRSHMAKGQKQEESSSDEKTDVKPKLNLAAMPPREHSAKHRGDVPAVKDPRRGRH
ncbi:hypothetical protein AAMO2058_001336800 [Amorphochlora amoebiformis]